MFKKQQKNSGFLLIEVIIAIALVSIVFISLSSIQFTLLNISKSIEKETKADFLVKEGFEALRSFRDQVAWDTNTAIKGLGNVSVEVPYHLVSSSGQWSLVSGVETIDIYNRQVVFSNAYRDGNGDFSDSGNPDDNAKKITVTVSWEGRNMTVVSYLTNWKTE